MQHRITKPSRLLNKRGELKRKGYATSPLLIYRRDDVVKKLRLKEWDYYLIYNKDYALALTVGKSNCLILVGASFIDFKNNSQNTKNIIRIAPKFSMPESSKQGDIIYKSKLLHVAFKHENGLRNLYLNMKNFNNKNDFETSIVLSKEPRDSMVIATPFKESKKHFYYNRKIIGMKASGFVRFMDQPYLFLAEDSYGILDWGRGVWPYRTTWYWAAAAGKVCGEGFGFNFGYGFGKNMAATENMIFFNGIANKLKKIVFHIPKNEKNEYEYMKPWKITSSDGRVELTFDPILDRSFTLNTILLATDQHQVFGKYSGFVVLDDDTIIYLKDFFGFTERVSNRW